MVCDNFKPRVFIEEPNFLSINSRLGYMYYYCFPDFI